MLNQWFARLVNAFPLTRVARLFVVAVCLSLLAMDGWLTWSTREAQVHEATVASRNLVLSLANHADDTIDEIDVALLGVVDVLEVDGTGQQARPRIEALLRKYIALLPQLSGLLVLDPDGEWIVNTQATPDGVSSFDRDYFQRHRSESDPALHIGAPIRTRVTGEWIIPLSRRFNRSDGSFAGVVRASVSLSYFTRYYERFDIGDDGVITLAFDSGKLIMRQPFKENMVNSSLRHGVIFRDHLPRAPAGVTLAKSVVDGTERLYGYQRLANHPLVVIAAMSKKEVLSGWQSRSWMRSLTVFFLVAVLALIGRRLIAQIERRLLAERQLRDARDDLQKVNDALEKLAMQDGLTGLANRRQLDMVLHQEFARAVRGGDSLALLMIDVDFFKQYNDHYGHAAGDECLKAVCLAIGHANHRAGDLAARYGGEEIAVLLPATDCAGAHAVAEKIRLAVRALEIPHVDSPFGIVTVSAGVCALVPGNTRLGVADLFRTADRALYIAKRSGRDRVADETMATAPQVSV